MKRILVTILITAMLLAMTTTAFAATIEENGGSDTISVNAQYVDGVTGATKYSVDVSWGVMQFTYETSGTKTWNAEHHRYDIVSSTGAWNATGNEITVTNHSNTGITASFAFSALTNYKDVTGSFTKASITLPTAEGRATDAADLTGKTTLTLGGTLAESAVSMTKIGVVTVTIS